MRSTCAIRDIFIICLISHISARPRQRVVANNAQRNPLHAFSHSVATIKNISTILLFLNIERLSTAALAFTVGIVEGKLRTKLGFLPIHDGTDDIE